MFPACSIYTAWRGDNREGILDAMSRVGDGQMMFNSFNDIFATVFSGWIVTWPTSLFAIIWLAFAASWILASVWSGRTKTAVRTLDACIGRIQLQRKRQIAQPCKPPSAARKRLDSPCSP